MLQDFISVYRDAIIARTRELVAARPWPPASTLEVEYGVPLFLTQLSETLRLETAGQPSPNAIGPSATRHGAELLGLGFTLSQVVHDYGDVCQAVTSIALEQNAPITTEEFHILNRCLDTAIAESVTEHGRITTESRLSEEIERLGSLAHEIRDMLNTALIALDILKRGTVSLNGSTGAVLARSLIEIKNVVDRTLSDVRLSANVQRRERVALTTFLEEIAVAARLTTDNRSQEFVIEQIDPELFVDVDPQLLASAVNNLLNNASKYSPANGRITLRAVRHDVRIRIEIEDECGGIPQGGGDLFEPFGERRAADRTGMGLGRTIARRAVRAQGGDISVRNMPGKGCVFVIELPLAVGAAAPAAGR